MYEFLGKDSENFNAYFLGEVFKRYPNIKQATLFVLEDREYGKDLIFTNEGIVSLIKGKRLTCTIYGDEKWKGNNLFLHDVFNGYGRRFYLDEDSKVNVMEFINDLRPSCDFYAENRLVFIENVDKENLGEWFKNLDCSKGDVRIVMYSTKDILEGYHIRGYEKLVSKHHLFQFVCSKEDFSLKKYRIVEFTNIETNLQEQLNKKGYIKYQ